MQKCYLLTPLKYIQDVLPGMVGSVQMCAIIRVTRTFGAGLKVEAGVTVMKAVWKCQRLLVGI